MHGPQSDRDQRRDGPRSSAAKAIGENGSDAAGENDRDRQAIENQPLVIGREMVIGGTECRQYKSEKKGCERPSSACIQSHSGAQNKPEPKQTGKKESQIGEHIETANYAQNRALVSELMVALRLRHGLEQRYSSGRSQTEGCDDQPSHRRLP